jgi:hypothetical protein
MLLTAFALTLSPVLFQSSKPKKVVKLQRILVEESADLEASAGDHAMLGVHLDTGEPVVRGLIEGGPAAEAGFQAGDRITKVGKKKVKDTEGLLKAIGSHEAGDTVKFRVMRDEERVNLSVTLTSAERLRGGEVSTERSVMIMRGSEHPQMGEHVFELNGDLGELFGGEMIFEIGGLEEPDGAHERGEGHEEEHVDFWESEDGSTKELKIHMVGDHFSPARLQELIHEHGIEIDLDDVEMSGSEVEIRVEIESDDEGSPRGQRLLEVLNRPGDEDLDALEDDQRRRMMQGQQRRGSAQMRWNQGDDRNEGRGMRRNQGDDRNEGRGMRRNQGDDRNEGRGMRRNQGGDRNEGRGMRENQGNDRNEGRGMRRNQGDDRNEGRQMRDDQGRDRSEQRQMRAGEHREDDMENSMHSFSEEFEHRMEEHRQQGEEMSRGFDDAMHEMEAHKEERVRSMSEERERVIEDLYRRIEEVSNAFEDELRRVEEEHGERMRQGHEERERRFEELREREEEMLRRAEEHAHQLEMQAEQEHR